MRIISRAEWPLTHFDVGWSNIGDSSMKWLAQAPFPLEFLLACLLLFILVNDNEEQWWGMVLLMCKLCSSVMEEVVFTRNAWVYDWLLE